MAAIVGDGLVNIEEHTLADDYVVKSGYLQKLGGGDGGRQNWKKRFFVYKTKTLEYYEKEEVSDNWKGLKEDRREKQEEKGRK